MATPAQTRSIAYLAGKAHPNWLPPATASRAIAANTTPPPAPPAGASHSASGSSSSPTVQPFLNPTQLAALNAWNVKYATTLSQLGENDTLAWAKYNQTLGADQFKNANQVDMTNQSMGARGMFLSSIRDNALNDLAVTLAQQQNALQTARDATLFHDQAQRTILGAQNSSTQTAYNQDMIANAQAVTPTLGTNTPAATTPAAAQHAGPSGGVGLPGPNSVISTPSTPRPSGATPANVSPAPMRPIGQPNSSRPQIINAAKVRAGGVTVRGSGGTGL